jgi:hypothetical protein
VCGNRKISWKTRLLQNLKQGFGLEMFRKYETDENITGRLNSGVNLVKSHESSFQNIYIYLTGGVNIVRYIKAQKLRSFGHIQRMEDDRMVKKLTNWKPFGKRPAGRP